MVKRQILIYLSIFTMIFNTVTKADHTSHYAEAIFHSSLHQLSPATDHLTTIQGPKVILVVFTTYDGYKTTDTQLGATIWTTVAPQVKQWCRRYVLQHKREMTHQQLTLWLAKLLGLPSKDADKRRFIELEVPVIQAYYGQPVSPIGIFRPCTDPRIGAHPDGSPSCPTQMNPNDTNIASDYKTWFINTSIVAHTLDKGMLWTEYGYTYNWNQEAISTEGVAEFVVLKGTPITVLADYMSAETYCGLNQ